jgi:hypothetical protein
MTELVIAAERTGGVAIVEITAPEVRLRISIVSEATGKPV